MNGSWYQDIADYSYLVKHNTRSKPVPPLSLTKILAMEIHRLLLVIGVVIQTKLVNKCSGLPIFGPLFFIAGFALLAWMCAYYSFEYIWNIKGWGVDRRMRHFETNYAYFLGFGTPCALATAFMPFFVSNGIFAMVFPALIILATESDIAESPTPVDGNSWFPQRLPILRPIDTVSSKILTWCDKYIFGNKAVPK